MEFLYDVTDVAVLPGYFPLGLRDSSMKKKNLRRFRYSTTNGKTLPFYWRIEDSLTLLDSV